MSDDTHCSTCGSLMWDWPTYCKKCKQPTCESCLDFYGLCEMCADNALLDGPEGE